jgi:hypothetical protein
MLDQSADPEAETRRPANTARHADQPRHCLSHTELEQNEQASYRSR